MATSMMLCLAQMTSGKHHDENIAALRVAVEAAVAAGCDLLALPELAGLMNRFPEETRTVITDAASDPFLAACGDLAAANRIWIHAGSTPVTGPDGKWRNHSVLFDARGRRVATYDKIHLFSAMLEGKRPVDEGEQVAAGDRAVVAETPWGKAGMSVCYDLRFPELYRACAKAGARLLFVPSAFTQPTGEAHWEVLLRARAIETGCFVIAAAQTGRHADGRRTHGHGMVVDPWGKVLCDQGRDATGVAAVRLDLSDIDRARAQIPSLTHDRPFADP